MDSLAKNSAVSCAQRVYKRLQADYVGRLAPGAKLPTVRELSRCLDVSVNTIVAAIDLLSRDGWVDKRHGKGVFVADRVTCWRVGILSELDLLDPRIGPSFRAVAGFLRRHLEAQGAEVHLYVGDAEPGLGVSDEPTCPRFWDDVAAQKLDGAVILDVPSTPAWYQRVRSCRLPLVGALTGFEVVVDNDGMMTAAVRELAARGCRRVGLVSWRHEGNFPRVVAEHGLTTCDAWIRADLDPALPGAGWEEFREIWSACKGRPDGLVVLDDMLFADVQLAIFELGVRVPQDVQLAALSVRGDATPSRLPVVRMEIDPAEDATWLAEMLLARLAGRHPAPVRHTMSFQLFLPESPPRRRATPTRQRRSTHATHSQTTRRS